jgi:hypothetical protein
MGIIKKMSEKKELVEKLKRWYIAGRKQIGDCEKINPVYQMTQNFHP